MRKIAIAKIRIDFDHAAARAFHGMGESGELGFCSAQARRKSAIFGAMFYRARSCKTQRAGAQAGLQQFTHLYNFGIARFRGVIRAAIAHDVKAQRAMGHLRADIHNARHGFQRG